MSLQAPYVFKTKPKRGPQCLSTAIAAYVFAYPNDVVIADQMRPMLEQKPQIGACSIELRELARSWHCKGCGMDFYNKNPNFVAWD